MNSNSIYLAVRLPPAPAIRATTAGGAARAYPRKRARKLGKYHLLILDDISYVSKDQAETSVLFELIGMRD